MYKKTVSFFILNIGHIDFVLLVNPTTTTRLPASSIWYCMYNIVPAHSLESASLSHHPRVPHSPLERENEAWRGARSSDWSIADVSSAVG